MNKNLGVTVKGKKKIDILQKIEEFPYNNYLKFVQTLNCYILPRITKK
jgi:hypothetical protein